MILSYKREGLMVRVVTDNIGRSEFVYPADRFSSLAELEAEIAKSLYFEERRKSKSEERLSRVDSELKLSGARDDTISEVVR